MCVEQFWFHSELDDGPQVGAAPSAQSLQVPEMAAQGAFPELQASAPPKHDDDPFVTRGPVLVAASVATAVNNNYPHKRKRTESAPTSNGAWRRNKVASADAVSTPITKSIFSQRGRELPSNPYAAMESGCAQGTLEEDPFVMAPAIPTPQATFAEWEVLSMTGNQPGPCQGKAPMPALCAAPADQTEELDHRVFDMLTDDNDFPSFIGEIEIAL